jgi:lysozyme family protein
LKPRSHTDKNKVVDDIPDKTDFQFQDFNMNIEQEKDLTMLQKFYLFPYVRFYHGTVPRPLA